MRQADSRVALLAAALGLGLATDVRAELIDRGTYNGVKLIYDTTQRITWIGDANWAQNSGADDDGVMTWEEASRWASSLRIAGFSDWRLPLTFDATCRGLNCTNSEMGSLFSNDGISADNPGPFHNVQARQYWSRRGNPEAGVAWALNFGSGEQSDADLNSGFVPWAVRDGDVGGEVSTEPTPGPYAVAE